MSLASEALGDGDDPLLRPGRGRRDLVFQAAAGRAEIEVVLESSPVRFLQRPGYETTILPFGSDAPYLEDSEDG